MLAQAVVMLWSWDTLTTPAVLSTLEAILISHILLTTCTALTFPLLGFVQSEQSLQWLAERDELTQVYNRRAFFLKGGIAFEKAFTLQQPFSVLMIDLDHFKQVNDQWGHGVGDEALQFIGSLLRGVLREQDIIGRLGGEELAVALPLTSGKQARVLARRLCKHIEEDGRFISGKAVALSASIGGAHRQAAHTDFASMVADADSALYLAKRQGRNRVQFSATPAQRTTVTAGSLGAHSRPA